MVRPTLLPPSPDPTTLDYLTALARNIVARVDSCIDPTRQVVEFNRQSGQTFDVSDFMGAAGSMEMRNFVHLALIPSSAIPTHLSDEELLELLAAVRSGEASEVETHYWLDVLDRNVPHPAVSDLIYWPEREMTDEEILAEALAYQLAPPAPHHPVKLARDQAS